MEKQKPRVFSIASCSLAELLSQARYFLAEHAHEHFTQRGTTRSANNILLIWRSPQIHDEPGLRWEQEEANWYLHTFVDKHADNDPLNTDSASKLLFPYTYAARSRFWDAGWAHLFVLVSAIRHHKITLAKAYQTKQYFLDMLAILGEHLHLQTALSFLALYPPPILSHYAQSPDLVQAIAKAWRCDPLDSAIDDLASNPHSRRAVVGSFCYPHLEEKLRPQMSKPPYQLFQFLPDNADEPLSSIHEHRSLDVVGGAQLDFLHDLTWLIKASRKLSRPIGDITIIAHNLHEYHSLFQVQESAQLYSESEVEKWLCSVTDGYKAGRGVPKLLLKQSPYATNAERIYQLNGGT